MESELGVLGVHGKLVKYVVHSFKRKKKGKIIFLHTSGRLSIIVNAAISAQNCPNLPKDETLKFH
jgi:hypothetical protein